MPNTIDNTENEDDTEQSQDASAAADGGESFMGRMFLSCSDDPKGSVHRAWGVSLIFLILYFILAIVEMLNLRAHGGSTALMMGVIFTGCIHLIVAILGTFILKRFPTSFALGFIIGILLVIINQNLILFGIFHTYPYGNLQTHHFFSTLCFTISIILTFFTALLIHFRDALVVAPIDAKGIPQSLKSSIHMTSSNKRSGVSNRSGNTNSISNDYYGHHPGITNNLSNDYAAESSLSTTGGGSAIPYTRA